MTLQFTALALGNPVHREICDSEDESTDLLSGRHPGFAVYAGFRIDTDGTAKLSAGNRCQFFLR
jgi:hypothetical protein